MTIQDISTRLQKQCDESLESISVVKKAVFLSTEKLKLIQDLVVKQAFLSVCTEWEHFLEDATVAYALGELSVKGFAPTKYISPLNGDHADRLIKGTANYPDWSNMELVKRVEINLFKDGEPFNSALNGFSATYSEIKKVRNVIVHNSIKSRDEFDSLVRTALSVASVGISPTEFLLSPQGSSGLLFYKFYIVHIQNAARLISEYEEQE